ncbi:hypothetical protein L218DRAFT_1082074 [Marasmius fiardii PR-910]|nr:hypothetical protein L218DRAFT_1082074 [Marasmius fiardii PR-910]
MSSLNLIPQKRTMSSSPIIGQPKPKIPRTSTQPIFGVSRRHDKPREPVENAPEPFIVIENSTIERVFRETGFPFGVQYEIARLAKSENHKDLVKKLTDTVSNPLRALGNNNVDAVSKLYEFLGIKSHASEAETSAMTPWPALDLEEAVLSKDEYGGIGHRSLKELGLIGIQGSSDDAPSDLYFGGSVDFLAKMDKLGDFCLEKVVRGPSNQLKRRFGSTRVLRCKISESLLRDGLATITFFQRPIVIWGWVFRAFYAKEDSVYLFRTDETVGSDGQKMTKWAARIALALSSSVPGPLLSRSCIHELPDIISDEGSDMTDGCGIGNTSFFTAVQNRYRLSEVPTAIQFRVFGAKGMLLRDAKREDNGTPEIWLRKSQIKIRFPKKRDIDVSHLTVNILCLSRLGPPAKLSTEVIINLHHNGVHEEVFKNIAEECLKRKIEPFFDFGGDSEQDTLTSSQRLWRAAEEAENVLNAMKARNDVTTTRLRGHSDHSFKDADILDALDGGGSTEVQSTAWWPDPCSGCPSSIAETVMNLLMAGFHPRSCAFLRDKIYRLAKKKIENMCIKHKWEVQSSAIAFAVPDPYEVLGPNEVYFRSSLKKFSIGGGSKTDIIVGEVLVTRSPCKLPTDVRKSVLFNKVEAVNCPDLVNIQDVVVFSVKGSRRLIDFLAGGDYDGDRVTVIWDPELVAPFTNSPEGFSKEPPKVKECFDEKTEKAHEFTIRHFLLLTDWARIQSLQVYLLGGLQERYLVGAYSIRHEKFTYAYGLEHEDTIREAYMFCTVLDSLKSGRKLFPRVRHQDINNDPHKNSALPWKATLEKISPKGNSASTYKPGSLQAISLAGLREQSRLGPFIMDVLSEAAREQFRRWTSRAEAIFDAKAGHPDQVQSTFVIGADPVLYGPWKEFSARAQDRAENHGDYSLKNDLKLIHAHVEGLHKKFSSFNSGSFTDKSIVSRQDNLRALSREFSLDGPQLAHMTSESICKEKILKELRASCAYELCRSNTGQQFPWVVAFHELCLMKAESIGFKPVIDAFADNMKLTKTPL